MHPTVVERLQHGVDEAATLACRALLELQEHRRSPDPRMRAAYHAVHELIGDLGSLRIGLAVLDDDPAQVSSSASRRRRTTSSPTRPITSR